MKGSARRQGFTLLELLMVVIIIAILAAIALPQYIKVSERARGAEAVQILGAVRTAEHRYKAQSATNDYTGVLAELDIVDDNGLLAESQNWDQTNPGGLAITANPSAGAGSPSTGVATIARRPSQYGGSTVGLTLTKGLQCGDFPPMFTPPVGCTAD